MRSASCPFKGRNLGILESFQRCALKLIILWSAKNAKAFRQKTDQGVQTPNHASTMTRLPLRSSLLSLALNLSVRLSFEANSPGRLRQR